MADEELKRRQTLDPAVAGILATHEQRQTDAHLPPKERSKKAREREKMRKRKPHRATYDLPLTLKKRIKQIADQHQVPISQVAAVLLSYGLKALDCGEIDLDDYKKETSSSPRYEYNLVLNEHQN